MFFLSWPGFFCKEHYPELTVEYTTSQYVPNLLTQRVDVSLYLTESMAQTLVLLRRIAFIFSVFMCFHLHYLESCKRS